MKKMFGEFKRKLMAGGIAGAVIMSSVMGTWTISNQLPDLIEPLKVYALAEESESETQEEPAAVDASKAKNQNKEKNENKSTKNETETESEAEDKIEYLKLSDVPDIQWLLHLLKQIRMSYGGSVFKSDYLEQNVNVMSKLISNPRCVCYLDYDIEQPVQAASGEQDPRGYINDKYKGCWLETIPESSVVWIAKNILHFDSPAIDSWTREEDYFYIQDGTYYAFMGGIGDDFRTPEIVGATRKGDRYYIYYNYVFNEEMLAGHDASEFPTRGFMMEAAYEEIDGRYYWTLYDETEFGHETAAGEVYQDKASEYAPTSCKLDYQLIDHEAHLSGSSTNAGTKKSSGSKKKKSGGASNTDGSSGSKTNIGSSAIGDEGFYGIWIGAWSDETSAYEQANQAIAAGYAGQVFMTTDWENLNANPYYVVTAGTYSSRSEAEAHLSDVQNSLISDAYVKHTGKRKNGGTSTSNQVSDQTTQSDNSNDSAAVGDANSSEGFYGIWIGAWSNEASAYEQADQAIAAGYAGQVFMTTDWENLNPNPYYVVTAGTYSSRSEAEAHLSDVQNTLISDAYIKYTGNHK